MSKISELTDEWLLLLQNRKDDAAIKFYCENIIPCLAPILKEKFQESYKQVPKYDGLISLLGFTPETVILTYQVFNPEIIVVLHTKETAHLLDTVCYYAKIPTASFFHEPFLEEPNIDIYRALEASLRRFSESRCRKAIELTGGKKTMGGALAIAAGILDIDLLYIDYQSYMPEFRKPKPESTYIHLVGNPMRLTVDLFGNIEIENAVTFFNIGKYDVSQKLFDQAAKKMENPRLAEIFSSLSQFYSLWNSFDFKAAQELATSLFSQVLKFHAKLSPKFDFNLNRLKDQIDTVSKLAEEDKVYLLWNFYFSAQRYELNGQNDIAALLYYRTLESVFDNALFDVSGKFDRSQPDYSLLCIDIEEFNNRFFEFRKRVYKNDSSEKTLPKPVAMFDALCILGALDNTLLNKLHPSRVANIAQIRNLSVYAHGIRPMTEQSISEIRKLATDALQAYIEIKELGTIEMQREKFEFMTLIVQKTDR